MTAARPPFPYYGSYRMKSVPPASCPPPSSAWYLRGWARILLPFVVAGGVLWGLHTYFLRQYLLTEDTPAVGLLAGDRCLVRLSSLSPQRGAMVAFNLHDNVFFDRCVGLPGDTLWISLSLQRLLPAPTSAADEILVLPRAHSPIQVTPRNAALLAKALCRYEDTRTNLTEDGKIIFGGKQLHTVTFTHDFYWLETHSPSEGFIAQEAFLGTPLCITYSFSPEGQWRGKRFFLSLLPAPPIRK